MNGLGYEIHSWLAMLWRRMCVIGGGTNKAMTTWSTIWPLTLLEMSSVLIILSRQTSNKYLNFGFYTHLHSDLRSWDGWRGAHHCKAKCTHQQLNDQWESHCCSSASAKFLHWCAAGKGMCVLGTLHSSMNETHSFFFGLFPEKWLFWLEKGAKLTDAAAESDEALALLVYENYWPSWKDKHEKKTIVRPPRYTKQEGMRYGEWKWRGHWAIQCIAGGSQEG